MKKWKLILKLAIGIVIYWVSRRTPPFAYQALVELYCITQGKSNDLLSRWISRLRPPKNLTTETGILGTLGPSDLQKIKSEIDDRGYFVFPTKLSNEFCEKILKIGLEQKSVIRSKKGEAYEVYNREAPGGVRYDFLADDLLQFKEVQTLVADPSLRAVAQAYLGTEPILDIVAMWWHTAFSKEPSKEAAQYYHFDMDRIKWLKFFFYVTDVKPENGPHCFIAGSHRTGGTPMSLLKKGYTRLTDAEVFSQFPASNAIEFNGLRGTIIAEDTRGLHKGRHVEVGDRLVFQLEFTNSLFGGHYDRPVLKEIYDPGLRLLVEQKSKLLGTFQIP